MLIFGLIVGIGLCLQGILAFGNLLRWNNLPITSAVRKSAGVAYVFFGVMFILAGIWRPFFVGAFVALILLIVVQRKIIVQRRALDR